MTSRRRARISRAIIGTGRTRLSATWLNISANEGELWIFPHGYPHSLQDVGPDGCEFIIAFD